MRKYYCLLGIALLAILCVGGSSCSSDREDGLSVEWFGGQAMIDGVVESIYVKGGSGTYSAVLDDENVATVELKYDKEGESRFNVIAKSKGNVEVTISDGLEAKSINVSVVDPYKPIDIKRTSSLVITDSKDKIAMEKYLLEIAFFKNENAFLMQKDQDQTCYFFANSNDIKDKKKYISKGNYLLKRINYKPYLQLTMDKKDYLFRLSGSQEGLYSFCSFFKPEWVAPVPESKSELLLNMTLVEDLTDKCREKYPNEKIDQATIESVVTFLYVRDYPVPIE